MSFRALIRISHPERQTPFNVKGYKLRARERSIEPINLYIYHEIKLTALSLLFLIERSLRPSNLERGEKECYYDRRSWALSRNLFRDHMVALYREVNELEQ